MIRDSLSHNDFDYFLSIEKIIPYHLTQEETISLMSQMIEQTERDIKFFDYFINLLSKNDSRLEKFLLLAVIHNNKHMIKNLVNNYHVNINYNDGLILKKAY